MKDSPSRDEHPPGEVIAGYLEQLRLRYLEFSQRRLMNLRAEGFDFLTILFTEFIWFGTRTAYEKLLTAMLSEQERQLLEGDPLFTQSWRIFINRQWRQKRTQRALILVLGGAIVVILAIGLVWSAFELIKSVLTSRK